MFNHELKELRSQLQAVARSHAVIEFDLDGNVLHANSNFLQIFGYTLEEIAGKHHRLIVDPEEARGPEYQAFWRDLARGSFRSGEYRRLGKDGSEHWIQASYSPLLDKSGKPYKVVKFALETTAAKRLSANHAGQIDAIHRALAVIEFALDGTILAANENFLALMGYRADEVLGRHHSMFVDPAERESLAYRRFWDSLRQGEFRQAEFRRVRKDGSPAHLQATYNPIFDPHGRLSKVVKYATDITSQVEQRERFTQTSMAASHTNNAILICDAQVRIKYVNRGFEQMSGYLLEEVVDRVPGSFLHGRHTSQATLDRIAAAIRTLEPASGELLLYNKENVPYWVSMNLDPVFDVDGRLERWIAVQTDITEAKERALDFHERMAAIESVHVVVEWSADGSIVRLNDYALSLFQVEPEQAASRPDLALPRIVPAALREQLEARGSLTRELTLTLPSGDICQLSATLQALRSVEGSIRRIVMYALDITERQRAVQCAETVVEQLLAQIGSVARDQGAIASQTNMLALNSAIEAAHAGEAGRSFGVLSQEVRGLAQRAEDSSRHIGALIADTQQQVSALRGVGAAATR